MFSTTEFPSLRDGNSKVVLRFLEKKSPKPTEAKEPQTMETNKYMLKWVKSQGHHTMAWRFGAAGHRRIITQSTNRETPFNDDIGFDK